MDNSTKPPVHAHFVRLGGFAQPTYVTPGCEDQGRLAATRTSRAHDWLSSLFAVKPRPPLFVVGSDHWNDVAVVPVYGLPQAFPDRVVVGTHPAPFWQSYLDVIASHLSPQEADRVVEVYGDPPDWGLFADLLVIHEVTHLYHEHDELNVTDAADFPRLWLAELFANIGLYGYVAGQEPDQLAALETICQLSASAGPEPWPVRDLNRMGDGLADGPLNYIWYEHLLVLVAASLWEARGEDGFVQFRDTLRDPDLGDAEILDRLTAIDRTSADRLRAWPA